MKRVYSHTKRSMLARCARMYFYEYYAAGCKPPVPEPQISLFEDDGPSHPALTPREIELAAQLEKLTAAPQHAGLILHDLIAQSLKNPGWQAGWFSRQARERFDGRAETGFRFVERFNRLPDAEERIRQAREKLLRALGHFFEDPGVRSLVDSLRDGAERLTEQALSGWPPVLGFSVMGRIDYCVRIGSLVEVVDWKMGCSTGDEDSLQLALYGIWAFRHFGVRPENVRVRRVFLGDARIEEARTLTPRWVRRAEARLRQDVEQMAELHPYGKAGHAEAFTPSPKEKVCEMCKFRAVCPAAACTTR